MQIHTPSPFPRDDGDFDVTRVNGHVVITLDDGGETRIIIENRDDAQRGLRAFAKADWLLTAQDEPVTCGAWIATDGHRTWYCQYPPGHDGGHGPRPGEEPEPLPDEPVEFWPSLTGRALAGNTDGAA